MATTTTGLYETAVSLIERHPEAADTGQFNRLVLMLPGTEQFFTLHAFETADHPDEAWRSVALIRPWGETGGVELWPGSQGEAPAWVSEVLVNGLPLPKDGSLYGYQSSGRVVALIAFYTSDCEALEAGQGSPAYSPMMLDSLPAAEYPAWLDQRLFGSWFWDGYNAGEIIDLGPAVAATRDTVIWVAGVPGTGIGYTAVTADIPAGNAILPQGSYVYHGDLLRGPAIPSVEILPGTWAVTDLGPRFRD